MSATAIPFAQVDVFTAEPFAGNPAAVCLMGATRTDGWMAQVGREMACAETAFVQGRADGHGFDLRWFTAGGVEVALCGHATLASAHVLYERGLLASGAAARFHTLSGWLTAARRADGGIEMDFPLERPEPVADPPPALLDAVGAQALWVGRNRFDYVVEIADERAVRALTPDLALLRRVETRGVIVTARGGGSEASGADYALRFFAPAIGVDEDMVTGSAQCALAPYWRARFGEGRDAFRAFQASPRGGWVDVQVAGERVRIGGHAVTVLRGELTA